MEKKNDVKTLFSFSHDWLPARPKTYLKKKYARLSSSTYSDLFARDPGPRTPVDTYIPHSSMDMHE